MNVLWDLAVGGVNYSIEGNGGPECLQYLPSWQRWLETVTFVPLGVYGVILSIGQLDAPFSFYRSRRRPSIKNGDLALQSGMESPSRSRNSSPRLSPCVEELIVSDDEGQARFTVLLIYSLVFGAELAFKMISRTGIFLLNPCHLTTVLQLTLLTMQTNKRVTCLLYRFHMYTMPGAILAILFPILNTRLLPGEVFVYYAQHFLIVLIPIYMVYLEGAFVPESFTDTGWPIFSLSLIVLYHFVILQFISLYTQVNLNCIMCPAVSDPFKGALYRVIAVGHQCVAVPVVTKLYNAFAVFATRAVRSAIALANRPHAHFKKTH